MGCEEPIIFKYCVIDTIITEAIHEKIHWNALMTSNVATEKYTLSLHRSKKNQNLEIC